MTPQRNIGAGAEAERPEYAGHYRLESCLGSGGMGVVHLARSTSGRKLAVKVVHAEFARNPEFRGRFRQEVAAARRVSGAFTASVVDADPESGRPWMATLYIPGPTLSEHVKRNGTMNVPQVRRLMAGLAEALRDIHRVGVVHRDLKPSNVLLSEDGPKVIDFGISRPKDSELRTETGKLIGTPPFMAPEQFRRPREVGPEADVFALGSVMVHAATGRGPFDADSPYIVAYQVVHDEPDLTGVPETLAPLVRHCLAKDPADRPTPDELMRELRSVAASYDTQAFIPAQRPGDGPAPETAGVQGENRGEGGGQAEGKGKGKGKGEGEEQEQEQRAGKPSRGRAGRKAALVVGGLGLVVSGAFASIRSLSGDAHPPPKASDARTEAVAFTAWRAKAVGKEAGMPQCSYGAGKLFCARPGVVFALSPVDGRLLWRHSTTTGITSAPPVFSGGLVQPCTGGDPRLRALDPDSGRTVWERQLPTGTTARCVGGMVLLSDPDGTVTGVDSATGDTKWHRGFPGQGAPAFGSFPGDSKAYAARVSADGSSTQVTAVDPRTGEMRWDARLSGRLQPFGIEDGTVFFLSVDRVYGEAKAVVRYDPTTGATRRVTLPVALADAHATVRGNTVHILAFGGSLEAVDMATGRRLWHLETSVSRGSPPVTDGRLVYFTAGDGRLLAVDARKGTLVGQTRALLGADSDRVPGAPAKPVVVGDRVYATAPDGTVFCVDGRTPSAW
ncbi:serine/threonine-protein kinase [Streptomyces sp. MUM 16J]|uniref:serine/threonine-protein kinase n=1 Tax=Streptomyces sp. MUM 16J TaxID=2791988 RepID=UPI001F03B625|nr:serine/threonine-protein kinase [Streptomyces sp. MUM 16J]MCH0557837.1 serine/threonine-protein kinase [Streptomyces sp. MUM 16J]